MKTGWGVIYCYLVLFITTCCLLVTSCFLISNVYDLYYPPNFEDQKTRIIFDEKVKDANFKWDEPANKKLKWYAIKHYERENSRMKNTLFLIFFVLISIIHVLLLRRFKKER